MGVQVEQDNTRCDKRRLGYISGKVDKSQRMEFYNLRQADDCAHAHRILLIAHKFANAGFLGVTLK